MMLLYQLLITFRVEIDFICNNISFFPNTDKKMYTDLKCNSIAHWLDPIFLHNTAYFFILSLILQVILL